MKTKSMYKPLKKIQIKWIDVTVLKSRSSEQKMASRGTFTN
ncbi:hypothetical protein [Bartonella tribocorum]|nr:hypothetical protein [Bartonella tribocorum]CDO48243.1 hypothetical protein BM1374166_00554 [Bartonella tribocorum]